MNELEARCERLEVELAGSILRVEEVERELRNERELRQELEATLDDRSFVFSLERIIARHAEALEAAQARHAEVLEAAQARHAEVLEAAQARHDAATIRHERAIADLGIRHERAIADLGIRHERAIVDLQQSHQQAIVDLSNGHRQGMMELVADHRREVTQRLDRVIDQNKALYSQFNNKIEDKWASRGTTRPTLAKEHWLLLAKEEGTEGEGVTTFKIHSGQRQYIDRIGAAKDIVFAQPSANAIDVRQSAKKRLREVFQDQEVSGYELSCELPTNITDSVLVGF